MAFQTRETRVAIVEESTEGTYAPPTAGTDFIAIQEDFVMTPSVDIIENAELKASLAPSKSLLGLENPNVSISHYLRHSGVEATAPGFAPLVKALFGEQNIQATERDVVSASAGSASAAGTITLDTGEGTEYPRGRAFLIKDGTNGYNIRPVKSVSGDVATLGFNLASAPSAGVSLGRYVNYSPVNSGHPSLSITDYRANQAAIQAMAGGKVTEWSVSAVANEIVNSSYTVEGTKFFYDPITIDATNDDMDFDDGGGEENVSVTQKTYRHPFELASALETAMNTATTDTITVSYSESTGKFTIASDGGTLSLLWNTGTNTATTIGAALGFATAADDTGSTSYEGDNAITLSSPYTPSFDSADPLVAKNHEITLGTFSDYTCLDTQSIEFTFGNEKVDVNSICQETGRLSQLFSSRDTSVSIQLVTEQYREAKSFQRFLNNTEIGFMYNFGTKTSGNWDAGQCGSLYVATATITDFELNDADGVVVTNMTLQGFADSSGNGEVYLNFL